METDCSVDENSVTDHHVQTTIPEIIEDNDVEPGKIPDSTEAIIIEPMVMCTSTVESSTDYIPASASGDETNSQLVKDVDASKVLYDGKGEETLFSQSNPQQIINDALPKITTDGVVSCTDDNMFEDPTKTACHNMQTVVTTDSIVDSSAIVDNIEVLRDENPRETITNTESTIISVPSNTEEDESVGTHEGGVQMTNALRGIAAAYSDSSDDEKETGIIGCQDQIPSSEPVKNSNYRCKESDDDTDSEEDSSSDSSSSDSSSESTNDIDSGSEDENINRSGSKNRRERRKSEGGEFDKLPPIEDLEISVPEVLCNPVGKVGWMVEQMVVVTQLKETKALNPTLNIDTVLFIERGRRVLGRIFDVFGTVSDPHYCVRFNDAQHIKENNIEVGMTVYYCPNTPYTTLVFMADLLKMKASDDVGDDEHPAFSDDEEERAYYSSLKQKQVNNNTKGTDKNTTVPKKRACIRNDSGWKSKHPWNNERQPHQKQQHHRNPRNYNNMQQLNTWQYPPVLYNHWNPVFHNWPQPFFTNSTSHYSSPSFQPNVSFSQQQRPSSRWPNNATTFAPTQTQNAPWRALTPPPPPPFPPLQTPPPPPPGI